MSVSFDEARNCQSTVEIDNLCFRADPFRDRFLVAHGDNPAVHHGNRFDFAEALFQGFDLPVVENQVSFLAAAREQTNGQKE